MIKKLKMIKKIKNDKKIKNIYLKSIRYTKKL